MSNLILKVQMTPLGKGSLLLPLLILSFVGEGIEANRSNLPDEPNTSIGSDVDTEHSLNRRKNDDVKVFYGLPFTLSDLLHIMASQSSFSSKRQFDPWGGKRSELHSGDGQIMPNYIKRQFSPWGGKRSIGDTEKEEEGPLSENSSENHWEERAALNSREDKRAFNAWGGKRTFNAWGGKRAFNAWGGKRTSDVTNEKRAFNAWGGKRGFNAWGEKRSVRDGEKLVTDAEKKRKFNSWGGKRDDELQVSGFYTPLKETDASSNV